MLAAQHSQMVQNKAITANCLIKVTDYTLSLPSVGKKVLCIAGLVVIKTGEEVGKRLGDPVAIKATELTSHQREYYWLKVSLSLFLHSQV